MEQVYLVDGSGYIYRAFYAVQALSTTAGFPTNALFGFTRMLLKLIRDCQVSHMAVAFDTAAPTFRHERYAEYKANRKAPPAELVPQFPYFRKIVHSMGVQMLEKEGVEADDIIATIALKLAAAGQPVTVVSGDKDLLQLVGPNIIVWDPMRDVRYSPVEVKAKLSVLPEQVRDYLALIGDTSDNVPGIKGIGPKTAERLIEHFLTVDSLIERMSEIEGISGLRGAKGVRGKIESSLEMLRLSRELVTLDINVQPFNSVESVDVYRWHGARRELLEPLFAELEFADLLAAIPFGDYTGIPFGDDAGSSSVISGVETAAPTHTIEKQYRIVTAETLDALAAELRRVDAFAFDTETSSLDVLECELVGISISWERHTAFYLPLVCPEGQALDRDVVRDVLGPIFADEKIKKVGVNLKFDIGVLEERGFLVRGPLFDAMLCSYVLAPDRRQHGLKALAQLHLKETMVSYEEMVGESEDAGKVPLERIAPYASHDADASWGLYEVMAPLLGGAEAAATPAGVSEVIPADDADVPPFSTGGSLSRVFEAVEMPLVPVLSAMERAGIAVDVDYLGALGSEFCSELADLERSISALAGHEFNLNSPKQLGTVLFEELKLPTAGVKKTQSGYSTDASVLAQLAPSYEIAAQLLEYRELHKLNSTYIEALKRLAHPETGRIHTSFNQATAATGRLSSSEPNLQNIPIRNPRGRRIRKAFVAKPGSLLVSADYSQIELRVLAHLSHDEALQQAFVRGEDIHERTAIELFGREAATELGQDGLSPKDLRRVAKTINFGVIYGMSAFRLAGELGIPRRQAQQYIDDYFGRYPRVLEYFDGLRVQIERVGYVETIFGRRRFAHEIDTTGRDAGYAVRSLLNAPIQGSAAEIIKVAMVRLYRSLGEYGARARMLLQVHDELVLEVEQGVSAEVTEVVRQEMEAAVPLDVPLRVDVRSGASWGE